MEVPYPNSPSASVAVSSLVDSNAVAGTSVLPVRVTVTLAVSVPPLPSPKSHRHSVTGSRE